MKNLNESVVLVTGGNSGIGYAAAKEFKARGANVIITGKRQGALDKASSELGVTGLLADQADLPQISRLADKVAADFGKIDALFLNAGVASFSPVEFASEAQFDTMADINFKGTYFTLHKFLPLLNEGAAVTILTSNATSLAMPNSSIYSSGKAALKQLTKVAAKELAPRRIRVNSVAPGPTETEMLDKLGVDEATLLEMKQQIKTQVPLSRLGTAEEVAKLVVYLCDPITSSFITGSEFVIDGGMSL